MSTSRPAISLLLVCTTLTFSVAGGEESFEEMDARSRPSILMIEAVVTDGAGRVLRSLGHGTGIIVSKKGYVLTDDHVITGKHSKQDALDLSDGFKASPIKGLVVTGRIEERTADGIRLVVVGEDSKHDLAVLRLEPAGNPARRWRALGVPDHQDTVSSGHVLCLGFPENLDLSAKDGIVSGYVGGFAEGTLIQTTVPVNPGDSGGPVFYKGTLLGLVEGERPDLTGVSLVIPIAYAADLLRASIPNWDEESQKAEDTGNVVTVDLRGIEFDRGSCDITGSYMKMVNQVGDTLRRNPSIAVDIVGHTDATEVKSDREAEKLSQCRARAMRDAVLISGARTSQIGAAIARGSSQPIDTNETEEGRHRNRRVEIMVRN